MNSRFPMVRMAGRCPWMIKASAACSTSPPERTASCVGVGSCQTSAMAAPRPAHVTLSGDISGDYAVVETRDDGLVVIRPETDIGAIRRRPEATPPAFEQFVVEDRRIKPPDGKAQVRPFARARYWLLIATAVAVVIVGRALLGAPRQQHGSADQTPTQATTPLAPDTASP